MVNHVGESFNFDDTGGWITPPLTPEEIARIDKAVSLDFDIVELTPEDKTNVYYVALKSMLEGHKKAKVLYERMAISKFAVLPRYQYLLGFRHEEGMCLVMNEWRHKAVACSDELERLNQRCFAVNGLQFVLQEAEQDKRWSYVPFCLCEHGQRCDVLGVAKKLRFKLWDVNFKE